MIQFNRNNNGANPPTSLVDPINKQQNDQELHTAHQNFITQQNPPIQPMEFNSNKYGCAQVKNQLKKITYGKCSYCDSKIGHVQYIDVDHFRPKSKYWWLTYTWTNLIPSCISCNRDNKKAKFPINGTRATGPLSDLNLEQHKLINPLDENPELLFAYDHEGDEAKIIARNTNVQNRADVSIEIYGLNRYYLKEMRRSFLEFIRVFKGLYDDPQTSAPKKAEIVQTINESTHDTSSYAGLARYYKALWGIP